MNFKLNQAVEVLRNTPLLLASMLKDLSPEWTENNEGGESWSAYDIVGHLIHGEKWSSIEKYEVKRRPYMAPLCGDRKRWFVFLHIQ